jgi:hypothetical protein
MRDRIDSISTSDEAASMARSPDLGKAQDLAPARLNGLLLISSRGRSVTSNGVRTAIRRFEEYRQHDAISSGDAMACRAEQINEKIFTAIPGGQRAEHPAIAGSITVSIGANRVFGICLSCRMGG